MSETSIEKQGSTLKVKPAGRLDLITAPELEKELQAHMDGVRDITMDFTNVDYISSGGLRVLLALEKQLEQNDGGLTVINANEDIIKIFELVGFTDVVTVVRA